MKILNTIKTMKKIYPNCIVMIKVGNFYYVYSKDSYIISYLFNYKIKESEGFPSCGFPISAIDKIKSVLKKTNLNYITMDNTKEMEESDKCIEFDKKYYDEIYETAEKEVSKLIKVQKLYETMLSQVDTSDFPDKLIAIEQILSITSN